MDCINYNIGQMIRKKRQKLQISAADLSVLLGISKKHLSRYEKGEVKINVKWLIKVSRVLDIAIKSYFVNSRINFWEDYYSMGNYLMVTKNKR
ncbi:helix-turn-helix domain-containing protein [Arsenophonus endosymbiont of Aleurodicus floccissimus]|uniref:helix-turn-helix domain-containing protein n=1 Tax=Arsenophonus endosymbiont of Aleurodicus floccissimus TaxID=2152761 RepID=UPI001EDF733F|nr:helix-turn-helix transcriptional regulator [Arsenophonus endosymbiont of Aleurodicus floccissimus]